LKIIRNDNKTQKINLRGSLSILDQRKESFSKTLFIC